jgi:hypothetical protein
MRKELKKMSKERKNGNGGAPIRRPSVTVFSWRIVRETKKGVRRRGQGHLRVSFTLQVQSVPGVQEGAE